MAEIRIRLLGNVAFKNHMKMSEGFLYDVPVDMHGIPYIPLRELLPQKILGSQGSGFAFPEGYTGLLGDVERLMKPGPDITALVRSCFTGKCFCPEEGGWIRFLKAGQVFYATLYAPEDVRTLKEEIASVTRLGIEREGISGLVECSLREEKAGRKQGGGEPYECGLPCDRLEITIMPLTPMCIHAPCADGVRTLTWVPGAILREALDAGSDAAMKTKLFSNAYISDGSARLLPVPLCMSLVKLDKTQLHYRLSSGKDPGRVEQDVSPGDAYARSFDAFLMTCTSPETERISAGDGAVYDALSAGQMFKGIIYGKDADLRALRQRLLARPSFAVGHLTGEGFGHVIAETALLPENTLKAAHLANAFDVSCLSHTLILNRMGMPDTTAEGMLAEIEGLLHAPDCLRIVDRYMDAYTDFSRNGRWGEEGPVIRCLSGGSVMRLETKDGMPVDITPILHAFIGERTGDGYGEIMSWPATQGYYRAARMVPPEKYGMELPLSYRSLRRSSELLEQVIRLLLKRRIQSLAVLDGEDDLSGPEGDPPAPLDLLRLIREGFDPGVSDELLVRWYREGLEEDAHEFFF